MEKSSEKVDKGFELVYRRLSYRRKFIRTIWMTPFAALVIFILFYFQKSLLVSFVITIIIVITDVMQLSYTYHKWKNPDTTHFTE